MAIQTNNLVLYKSERLTDTSDGGGKYSGQVVVDGESNNLFPDVSELDRTMGRVSMRKIYAGVNSEDTDALMGSTVFISENPADTNVSALLFSTKNWTDTRINAQSRLEDYLVRAGVAVGKLLDTAFQSMSIIQMIMSKEDKPNAVNETLVLIKNEGQLGEFVQYVRIKKVETAAAYFNLDASARREYQVATYTLEQPLLADFVGISVAQWNANATSNTTVRNTMVADSGKYFASEKLKDDAAVGQYTVLASSIFKQLVPVGQIETPMLDLNPNGESITLTQSSSTPITQSYTVNTSVGQNLYIGSSIMPSSVSFTLNSQTITDAGGLLVSPDSTQVGTIDYQRGLIKWTHSAGAGVKTIAISFIPAAAPLRTMQTQTKFVIPQTQSRNWTGSLVPLPSPTTVRVSFMSQGNFYELVDDGNGKLVAASNDIGVGTINYTTGTWLLTTGALPDVGSIILVQYGSDIATYERGNTAIKPLTLETQLEKTYIKNLTITWQLLGVTKTASVSASGVISGDATGRVNMATGKVVITPNLLPQKDSDFTFGYDWGASSSQTVSGTVAGGTLNLTIGTGTALTAGGVSLSFTVYDKTVTLHDVPIDVTTGNLYNGSSNVGTIDYVSGAVSITAASLPTETYISGYTTEYEFGNTPCPVPSDNGPMGMAGGSVGGSVVCGSFISNTTKTPNYATHSLDNGTSVSVSVTYNDSGLSGTNSEVVKFSNVVIDITNGYDELILAGSARFKIGNSIYIDRDSVVYRNIDPNTGAGVASGSISYANGRVTLTGWNAGESNTASLQALCTTTDMPPIYQLTFRTPVIPLRPQGITITVPTIADGTLTLTADADGVIDEPLGQGFVDYTNGVVQLTFTQKLEITALNRPTIEAEPWYDVSLEYEESGKTYLNRPVWINPSVVRYNAIAYSYIPLDPLILGVDTTRLPIDGRVPIFRKGDIAVVSSAQSQVLPSHVAGTTYDLDDARISYCELEDASGVKVNHELYTVDYDLGKVTLGGDFVMTGLTAPITAKYRYQDMGLVSDVQITGQVTLTKPLTHNYDKTDSIVGSALVIGDMQSRYTNKFVQATWSNVFSDTPSGAAISANYNDAIYPILFTNKGAAQERWAIVFTDASSFRIIGETSGQIGTGTTSADCSPMNPVTNSPYFTIKKEGWGAGWANGNVLRFNTIAATYPIWCIRTVKQSEPTTISDKFQIMYRGDIDREV